MIDYIVFAHIVHLMRNALHLFGVIFVFSATSVTAYAKESNAHSVKIAEVNCNSKNATQATVTEVNSDFNAWRGKCVSIDALLYRVRIYANRDAVLDKADTFGENLARSRVLPISPAKGIKLPVARPARFRVIGRLGSCQEAYSWADEYRHDHPGEIIFLSGLCHYTTENYVVPVRLIDLHRGPEQRLTETEVASERRRLRVVSGPEMNAALPYIEAAEQWLNAFASKDQVAALRLQFVEYDEMMQARTTRHRYEGLEDNFRTIEAGYRKVGRSMSFASSFRGIQPMRVFAETIPGEYPEKVSASETESSYTMCWCKEQACEGKWPVALWDADNDPSRPYFCIEASDYVVYGQGTKVQVRVPISTNGFAEPHWRKN